MNEIINEEINVMGINDFLYQAEKYTKDVFPNLNIKDFFQNSLTGNIGNVFNQNSITKLFSREIQEALNVLASILLIIIIHSLLKSIVENLENNSSSSQIVYFIQYIAIVTVIVNSFVSILDITKETINEIINFMNLLIPIFVTLLITTGNLVTTNIIQPILIFLINFIGNFTNVFLLPILLISITLSIISNISDKVQINKLSKFLKSSIVWILGIILTIFVSLLSIEGTLSSSVDGLTSKTAKAAVSNFIPVVGKIMGDSVETVLGCTNILKNSVGIVGVIIIIGISLIPLIKISVLWIAFNITSCIVEVIADEKIIKLIDNIADSYKILLAILISVSIMFIIGITIVIKITNSSLMYR